MPSTRPADPRVEHPSTPNLSGAPVLPDTDAGLRGAASVDLERLASELDAVADRWAVDREATASDLRRVQALLREAHLALRSLSDRR